MPFFSPATMKISIIDSHAHLFMKDFDHDREEVITRAAAAGVSSILVPLELLDSQEQDKAFNFTTASLQIYLAAGIHPHRAQEFRENHLQEIEALASKKKIIALGEIGLDYYYHFSPPEEQKRAFLQQLLLAQALKLPVIIHSRLAAQDVLNLVKEAGFSQGGVLHCFTENYSLASEMMERGFFISFSGIVTFPNAHSLREIATKIPLENLLVETDAPYLTPHPRRKKIKRNEPSYLIETVCFLAELKEIEPDTLASHMANNFQRCFLAGVRKS